MKKVVIEWILSIIAAVIMGQTLFFKFTGHKQSVDLFTTLGVEPWGRIMIGILELIASVLLLIPLTRAWGALLGVGLMSGAMTAHIIPQFGLGISVDGDGGYLFGLGVLTFVCSVVLFMMRYKDIFYTLGILRKERY